MGARDPRGIEDGGHDAMRDARPIHRVAVDGFWMEATEVTNEQFARFVKATGYMTVAERKPTRAEFPDAPEANLVAGSVVFNPTERPVRLDDHYQWWKCVPGANWRHPMGPESDIKGRGKYPVVQVAYEDAVAYVTWAVRGCRRRPRGSSRHAAGSRGRCIRGVTSCVRTANGWRTSTRAGSR